MMVCLYILAYLETLYVTTILKTLTDLMVFLQAVNTSVSEGSSLLLEVIVQGQLADNFTVTYHLEFVDGTANGKKHYFSLLLYMRD